LLVPENEARDIRIIGRVIILAVSIQLLWFSLYTVNSLPRLIAPFGVVILAYALSVVVDKIARRKTPLSPSEREEVKSG
jgi:hypothetical protein